MKRNETTKWKNELASKAASKQPSKLYEMWKKILKQQLRLKRIGRVYNEPHKMMTMTIRSERELATV